MMLLYNSLVKNKVEFVPIEDGKVKLYTCGPTVYDYSHVGNFRTFLFEDLLKRVLIAFGFEVKHVMNITDVDDKTISKSTQQQIELKDLTQRYTNEFMKDIDFLRILRADEYPNATDHVDEMILMIQTLIDKEHAYISEDGSVFFKIDSCSDYGVLVNIEKSENSHRYEISDEYSSDNANDFALWKSYKKDDGKIYWDSPWGKGRPGWHIECSAMATKYLGDHFDIHCGGVDNKFPHHENEIAQSCANNNSKKLANYWIHNGFITYKKQKMSKSVGNITTIKEASKKYSGQVVRLALLSAQYKQPLDWNDDLLLEQSKVLDKWYTMYSSEINSEIPNCFQDLLDDLNTPLYISKLHNLFKKCQSGDINKKKEFNKACRLIGLFEEDLETRNKYKSTKVKITKTEILDLINKRQNAKNTGNYKLADEIRGELDKEGIVIEDKKDKTEWKYK